MRLGLPLVIVFALLALVGPWLAPHDPQAIDLAHAYEAPSATHWLGTGDNGVDLLSVLLHGARLAGVVGLLVVAFTATVGTLIGALAGFSGGRVDAALSSLADLLQAFPGLVLNVAILALVDAPGVRHVVLALCIPGWVLYARIARAEALRLRQAEFVQAAVALGATRARVLVRHVIPNLLGPIVVQATTAFGGVVLADGMPAPGFAGQFNSFNSRPHMSSDGIQTWIAGLSATSGGSTTRRVLYRRPSGGGIAVQFTGGDLIGGIATDPQGISFEHDFSNRANHWSQIFTLTGVPVTSDSVLAVDTNVIGREGFPIPNGLAGENWGTFRTPSVNENGNTLFAALTTASANQNDVLCYNNRIVLRETDTVDGVLLQNLPSNDTAISDTELGAFSFGTTDATRRIFISRANCPIGGRLLVGPGTPLDSDGDAVADFTVSRVRTSIGHDFTISNTGTVFVRLDLLPVGGGAAIECIVGLPLPKPGDANYDNEVNSDDFDLLVAAFGSVPGAGNWNAWCDFNFDCNVDSDDFDILVGNFGG